MTCSESCLSLWLTIVNGVLDYPDIAWLNNERYALFGEVPQHATDCPFREIFSLGSHVLISLLSERRPHPARCPALLFSWFTPPLRASRTRCRQLLAYPNFQFRIHSPSMSFLLPNCLALGENARRYTLAGIGLTLTTTWSVPIRTQYGLRSLTAAGRRRR